MSQLQPKTKSLLSKPFLSKSPEETKKIAEAVIQNLIKKMGEKGVKGVICLHGDLGTGKTTFAKGCARALGIEEKRIKSPSFTYIREHKKNSIKLYHCDFYRLEGKNEWVRQAFDELHNKKDAIFIIEWSKKLEEKLPKERIDIYIEGSGDEIRIIKISDKNMNNKGNAENRWNTRRRGAYQMASAQRGEESGSASSETRASLSNKESYEAVRRGGSNEVIRDFQHFPSRLNK